MPQDSEYLLGANEAELHRLRFQHRVWGPVTNGFFDRLDVGEGWKCLDVGAGPGFVSLDLRERVGQRGEVTALDPSRYFLEALAGEVARRGWTNVRLVPATVEGANLPAGYYDLVYARWVISFVPDPQTFIDRIVTALRPGGVIAVQDYYYEGLSLHPRGGPWDRMADIVRAFYRSGGGDPYISARLPPLFNQLGLELIDFLPHTLAGGPTSDVFEWAQQFFDTHTPLMVERGIITRQECNALLDDWQAHRNNPDALLFSPIVVNVAARLRPEVKKN
jgi:SAM-dependent methyltransferase